MTQPDPGQPPAERQEARIARWPLPRPLTPDEQAWAVAILRELVGDIRVVGGCDGEASDWPDILVTAAEADVFLRTTGFGAEVPEGCQS